MFSQKRLVYKSTRVEGGGASETPKITTVDDAHKGTADFSEGLLGGIAESSEKSDKEIKAELKSNAEFQRVLTKVTEEFSSYWKKFLKSDAGENLKTIYSDIFSIVDTDQIPKNIAERIAYEYGVSTYRHNEQYGEGDWGYGFRIPTSEMGGMFFDECLRLDNQAKKRVEKSTLAKEIKEAYPKLKKRYKYSDLNRALYSSIDELFGDEAKEGSGKVVFYLSDFPEKFGFLKDGRSLKVEVEKIAGWKGKEGLIVKMCDGKVATQVGDVSEIFAKRLDKQKYVEISLRKWFEEQLPKIAVGEQGNVNQYLI